MHGSRNLVLLACWGLIFIALIANAAVKYFNVTTLIDNDRWVAHTHEVKERLRSLLASLAEAESAMRGFIITGQQEFLQPFIDANERIDFEHSSLRTALEDNSSQQALLDETMATLKEYRSLVQEAIDLRKTKGIDEASAITKSGKPRAMMVEMRDRINVMMGVEDELLRERALLASSHYRRAIYHGLFGTILSIGVAGLAFYFVREELKRRHATEKALTAQVEETNLNAEQFRMLTATVPIRIWTAQPDGMPTFFNQNWSDYTGLASDEVATQKWLSAIHPDDVGRLREFWNRSDGNSKDLYVDEVRVLRSEDQSYRWHRCAVVPVRTRRGDVKTWVGTLADIQDQKDLTESLEQAVQLRTQELRRANGVLQAEIKERVRAEERTLVVTSELRRSNEELEKFAYVASHDLQEPLRKIQAFGDRLLRKNREQLDESGQGYLDRMLSSATRMRTLIDDLLSFSRVASTDRHLAPVDLQGILAGVSADLETALSHTEGRIETQSLPTIEAEPHQMRQLFQNLLGNALKFSRPGVPPVIRIEAARLDSLPADANPPPPPFLGWRLAFIDNGIGFDQVHHERIFEIFQRLHGREQYEGTGIGLAICRKIVERHGGQIHARGELGNGAAFYVDLPDAPPATFLVTP